MQYIAYYRVSTKHQEQSGLGLEAQRRDVRAFLKEGDELIAEFQDIETGRSDTRPQLLAAIEQSKQTGATLLIAKVDRLARNVSFVFGLRDSGVKFICLDLPDANTLTLGIMVSFAQYESERIRERIKSALRSRKERGLPLGRPQNFTNEGRRLGAKARNHLARTRHSKEIELVRLYRGAGLSYQKIADAMNREGYKTTTGKPYRVETVRRLERHGNLIRSKGEQ